MEVPLLVASARLPRAGEAVPQFLIRGSLEGHPFRPRGPAAAGLGSPGAGPRSASRREVPTALREGGGGRRGGDARQARGSPQGPRSTAAWGPAPSTAELASPRPRHPTRRPGARLRGAPPAAAALQRREPRGSERVRAGPRSHSGRHGGSARGRGGPTGGLREGAGTRPPPAPCPARRPAPRAPLFTSPHLVVFFVAAAAAARRPSRGPPPPPAPPPALGAPPPSPRLARSRGPRRGQGGRGAPALNAPALSAPRPRPPQPVPCGAVFTTRDRPRPPAPGARPLSQQPIRFCEPRRWLLLQRVRARRARDASWSPAPSH